MVHHGKSVAIYNNLHLPHIRHIRFATVFIALCHREGHQSAQIPTGLRQEVSAGALEVIFISIKGVEVWIAPRPAGAVVQRHTHGLATFKLAGLFLSTVDVLTWICRQKHREETQKICYLIIHYRCCLSAFFL